MIKFRIDQGSEAHRTPAHEWTGSIIANPYSSALDQLGHPINGKEKSVLHMITFYSLKHHKYILNFNTEKVQHKKIKQ